MRLREINGRWIASADTPDGPSLGLSDVALEAITQALTPFDGVVDAPRLVRQHPQKSDEGDLLPRLSVDSRVSDLNRRTLGRRDESNGTAIDGVEEVVEIGVGMRRIMMEGCEGFRAGGRCEGHSLVE